MIDRLLENALSLRRAQKELSRLPVREIVRQLCVWADTWRSPSSLWRQEAARRSDFPFEMAQPGLETLLDGLTDGSLLSLLAEETGDPLVLDAFRPRATGGERRAMGYPLVGCILAANTPLLAWPPLIACLLVKSACLIKLPSDESAWPSLFIDSLRQSVPALGNCLAPQSWPGGDDAIESAFARAVDALMIFGSDTAIDAWQNRWLPHKPLLPYGHRASFAVLTRETLTPEAAESLAWDVGCYDQQGCLSPQAAYVEDGGETPPEIFAGWVAEALARLSRRFPCRRDFAQSAAVRRERSLAAFSEETRLWHDERTDWTVALAPPGAFPFSCACRFIYIVPFRGMEEIAPALQDASPSLEAVGLAAPPHRREAISEALAGCGISRICPVGRMQAPPLAWRHNGQPLLGRLIRWIDREDKI